MDCFKSGLDWPPELLALPVVLAGLGGAAGWKKSRPRSESLDVAVVVFGGAGSALGGMRCTGGPELARTEIWSLSPPIKSTARSGFG